MHILKKLIPIWDSPHSRFYIVIFTGLLLVPMLFVPYALDDHLFLLASSDAAAGERRLDSEGPFDLYSIALGSSDRMQSMMDSGIYYPWWTLKSFKLNFFRPLGSAAIWLDLWLGLPAWAAHLHSLLWFAALLTALFRFYALIFPAQSNLKNLKGLEIIGFLAWFIFAIDDSNAVTIGWISHRYSIISLTFSILALHANEEFVQGKGPGWFGPILYMVSLLAGETALTMLGFFFLRDLKKPLRAAPYIVISIIYLLWYKYSGFGSFGSGSYIDPFTNLFEYIRIVLIRWPALFGAKAGLITTDFWVNIPVDSLIRPVISLLGYLLLAAIYFAMKPFSSREIWLGGGALLALIPPCAIFPNDRLLLASGVGLAPIFARFILQGVELAGIRKLVWYATGIIHVLLPVVLLPVKASMLIHAVNSSQKEVIAAGKLTGSSKNTVIINAPSYTLGLLFYSVSSTYLDRSELPRNLFLISAARSEHKIFRINSHTFEVEANFLDTQLEKQFRDPAFNFSEGDTVSLNTKNITIIKTGKQGRPRKVRIEFYENPEDMRWLVWRDGAYSIFQLPEIGQMIKIEEPIDYPYI